MAMVVIVIRGVHVAGLHHGDHTRGGIPRGCQGGIQPALRTCTDHHVGSRQGDDILGGRLKAVHILSGFAQNGQLNHPVSPVLGIVGQNGAGEVIAREANGHDGSACSVGGRLTTAQDRPHTQEQGQAK